MSTTAKSRSLPSGGEEDDNLDYTPSALIKVFDSEQDDSFPRFLLRNLRELRHYRFALINFVLNNLRMRYRRSSLGFLWSLLNPLLVMTVISVVFSIIFRQDLKTFAVYIFSGLAPWLYINAAVMSGGQTIINAEGFLKKVYLPKVLFPMITVTTETANFLFSITSLYILAILLGFRVEWTIVLLPLAILITFFFNLGLAIIFGVATVYFRDLTQIMMVVFQALFYLVPIVYPLESIPEQYRVFFYFNPFYYFVMLFRKVIYGIPEITWLDWIITSGMALVAVVIGMFILMKQDRDLIYRL